MMDWTESLTKLIAQAGAMGAVVSLMVESFRPLLPLKAVKLLVLIGSIAFVYFFNAYPLGAVGLQSPNHFLGVLFNGLLVAGAAKGVNDGLNMIDRMGDKK